MIPLLVLVLSTLVLAQDAPAPQVPGAIQPQPVRSAAQLANIRIELTIIDQRSDAAGPPKTVTMLIEDRQSGRIRTGRGNASLNVDGRPDGPDRAAPTPIQESVTALLEDGKALVVSQSADPSGDRKVRLEVKATIVK